MQRYREQAALFAEVVSSYGCKREQEQPVCI